MNSYIILANVLVFIHLLYAGFVVLAVPVIIIGGRRRWKWVRNLWFRLIHFIMMAIVIVETCFGYPCPLTTWETDLREAGGQIEVRKNPDGSDYLDDGGNRVVYITPEYQGDFIGRVLQNILFLQPLDVPRWLLDTAYFCFGALILVTVFLIPPRWLSKSVACLTLDETNNMSR